VDNYSTELQVDASANGAGSVGNMYVVDGLDRNQCHPARGAET